MGNIHRILGNNVKKHREQHGWLQSDLAQATGLTKQYISEIERGKKNVSLDVVERIASTFDVKISDLFSTL